MSKKENQASWCDALIAIENDVPMGPAKRGVTSAFYDQVRTMAVGQSFLFPYTRQPICANLARATGFKFSQRKEGEDKMRIWRVE